MVSVALNTDLNTIGRSWRLIGWLLDNVRLARVSYAISTMMVLLLLAGVAGTTITLSSVASMGQVWSGFDTGLARRLMLLSELRQHLGYGGLTQHFHDYVLSGQPLTRQAIVQDFARLREIAPAYIIAGASEREKTALKTLLATIDVYEQALARIEPAVARREPAAQVLAQVNIDDRPALDALDTLGQHLKHEHMTSADRITDGFWTMGTTVVSVMTLTGVLLLLLGLFFFWFIRVRLIRPLHRLGSVMEHLSQGDKRVDVPLVDKADEIGDMARAVLVFKESMIRADALEAQKRAADARLLERARRRERLTQDFGDSATRMLSVVHDSVDRVRAMADSLLHVAESTGRQTHSVAAAAQQGVQNVQAVAGATEQLGCSGQEIGTRVAHSAEITREAVQSLSSLNTTMHALDTAAERIDEIVTLISKIAAQTNLLALNASIEAQRAGPAGKGFTVVAGEVKMLARETTRATEDIARHVTHIQATTRQAVAALDEVGHTILQADEVVAAIAAAVEEQNAAIGEIHRNIHQAAYGNAEVSDNIARVSDGAEHTGTMAQDMVSVVEGLASEAEIMKEEVETFITAVCAQ